MSIQIFNEDCLKMMKELPDKSIDLFICDLPYGETNCKWDSKIDLVQFWSEFKRLRKSKRTACIHFCSTKFGYTLIKSWEKGFKMDMVWKKRNKTGGLQSKHRPMRNHEMVYFFYEQAPKYNRDKYHKRIQAKNPIVKEEGAIFGKGYEKGKEPPFCKSKYFEPPNPVSVMEEKDVVEEKNNKTIKSKDRKAMGESSGIYSKENQTASSFEPPNPAAVVEEKDTIYNKNTIGWSSSENNKTYLKANPGFTPRQPGSVVEEKDEFGWDKSVVKEMGNKIGKVGANFHPPNPVSVLEEKDYAFNSKEYMKTKKNEHGTRAFEPPNPASVVEEKDPRINEKGKSPHGWDIEYMDKPRVAHFDPKLPVSVLEEKDIYGETKKERTKRYKKNGTGAMNPPNPASVVEEFIVPAEDEPKSMFESTKVFIGKRFHQTQKPDDILEFFLKYWTDKGDTVLDPTMGSGSTGVACKKLGRAFIGYEFDEKIFEVAKKRLDD